MKSKRLLSIRFFQYLLGTIGIILFLPACYDQCEVTQTYRNYTPVFQNIAQYRSVSIQQKAAEPLKNTGKIYSFGNYIFINEIDKGIHIINNSNPTQPQNIAFIPIPGNVDMAVKNNILYADSYLDMVVLDISNPQNVQLVKRLDNVFAHRYYYYNPTGTEFVKEWKEEWKTEKIQADCQGVAPQRVWWGDIFIRGEGNAFTVMDGKSAPNAPQGKGGSLARFAIHQDYLYTIGDWQMELFGISSPANPSIQDTIQIGGGIETIFPYQDKLFIGSRTGMYIYDNTNPAQPTYLSHFAHARACDPVAVEGNYAYVTLRSDNPECDGFSNQLDVINIQNITQPTLVRSYPMQSPYGVGIDQNTLFVCEGQHGLKAFDARNPNQISSHLLANFQNHHAFDVIPLGDLLLVIGEDGLYQYDYSNPQNIKLVSKIPIE
jgi:hypothetical protein